MTAAGGAVDESTCRGPAGILDRDMIALMVTTAANDVDRWVKHPRDGHDPVPISSGAEEGACSWPGRT